jgi:ribosomal protein S18 acetylase RimI-like enzyme
MDEAGRKSGMKAPVFRSAGPGDIEATYAVRASTRENPISKDRLIEMGFTPESVRAEYLAGAYVGRVCEAAGEVVGFCTGDTRTGEILSLAVRPDYEGRGIGIGLLKRVVGDLLAKGAGRIWLSASPDPRIRAHGFYRANGWVPTGEILANGDQVLIYSRAAP